MKISLISTGEIELKEMVEIVGTLYEMEGMSRVRLENQNESLVFKFWEVL